MKSKITIDTIKSESARFQIENYTTAGRMLSKAAISAVVKAEQDAEERAAKATKSMIDGMVIATDIEKQAMMDYYNYCYNNGGQSDE